MKKYIACALMLLASLGALEYGTLMGPEQGIRNSLRIGDDWYLELGDTYWKIEPISTHWRTPGEVWNGAPCSAKDDQRFIFKYWTWTHMNTVFAYMANGRYILENAQTGELAYAHPISPCHHGIPTWSVIETFHNGFYSVMSVKRLFHHMGQQFALMDDNSYWEIFHIRKNIQSWDEWWHSIEPAQPDGHFLFRLSKWGKELLTFHGVEDCLTYLLEDRDGNVAFARYVKNSEGLEAYLRHMDEMAREAVATQAPSLSSYETTEYYEASPVQTIVVEEAPPLSSYETTEYYEAPPVETIVVEEAPSLSSYETTEYYEAPPVQTIVVEEAPPLSSYETTEYYEAPPVEAIVVEEAPALPRRDRHQAAEAIPCSDEWGAGSSEECELGAIG